VPVGWLVGPSLAFLFNFLVLILLVLGCLREVDGGEGSLLVAFNCLREDPHAPAQLWSLLRLSSRYLVLLQLLRVFLEELGNLAVALALLKLVKRRLIFKTDALGRVVLPANSRHALQECRLR
jgi:hypothetical protein